MSDKVENKKSKKKIVKTKFATVIQDLDRSQKKALDQLLFSATAPTFSPTPDSVLGSQGRQLPQIDPKTDHLFIKSFSLKKNLSSGLWEVNKIETNQGSFGTSSDQTSKLDIQMIQAFVAHLKEVLEPEVLAFLQSEKEDNNE
jgi:hypothetical protein